MFLMDDVVNEEAHQRCVGVISSLGDVWSHLVLFCSWTTENHTGPQIPLKPHVTGKNGLQLVY